MTTSRAGIYAPATYLASGEQVIDEVRASGFATVVAWTIHVWQDGDLAFDQPFVSNGEWVGDASWPALYSRLKEAPTSVDRLLFCVGSADATDFGDIAALIAKEGTGPDSTLYRNFKALKEAIPQIDGIDFDDEEPFDGQTIVAFAQMLHEIGFEVTFCPYTDAEDWVACLKELNGATPGLVTAFNLQCYAGGGGNQPQDWIDTVSSAMGPSFDAAGLISPGLWCINGDACDGGQCPESIQQQFAGWKATGITSGWIWRLDDVDHCQGSKACSGGMAAADYATAITTGLG